MFVGTYLAIKLVVNYAYGIKSITSVPCYVKYYFHIEVDIDGIHTNFGMEDNILGTIGFISIIEAYILMS